MSALLARAAALCAIALTVGCTEEQEPERSFIDSGHIRLYHELDPECSAELDGAAAFLDRSLVGMAAYMALPVPDTVEYHWLDDSVWSDASLCPNALACTSQGGVIHAQRIIPHELGHALLRHAFGGSRDSFFEEGTAEALGGGWSSNPIEVPASIDDLLGIDQISQDEYELAGRFVGYLLVERGSALLLELLHRIPKGVSAGDVASAFSETYGMSIEAALAEVGQAPLVRGSLGIGYCSGAESLALDGGALEVEKTMAACGYPLGSFTVELPTGGVHQLDALSSGVETFFTMRRCPLSNDGSLVQLFESSNYYAPRSTQIAEMGAGRYFVGTLGDAGLQTTFSITSAPRGLSCADAIELSVQHDELVVKPAAGKSLRVFLRGAIGLGPADVRILSDTSAPPTLCDACEGGTCIPLEDDASIELEPGITYSFQFTADALGDQASLHF